MLLTTPLDTDELLRGKLRGILDAMTPFLMAYGVFALIPSVVSLDMVSGVLTLMALAATWLAMYLLGAAGILSSVRAQSSGQSLLNTLITGYGLIFNTLVTGYGPRVPFIIAAAVFGVALISQTSSVQQGDAAMFFCAWSAGDLPGNGTWPLPVAAARDYLDSAPRTWTSERVRETRDIPLGRTRRCTSRSRLTCLAAP